MLVLSLLILAATRAVAAPIGSASDDSRYHDTSSQAPGCDAPTDCVEGSESSLDDELGDDDLLSDERLLAESIDTGITFVSTAFLDAAELRDIELRHRRPSRWGRVDVSLAWRRAWTVSSTNATRSDALWITATWSR